MIAAGVAMVKDEADVIAAVVAHMLEQLDLVVVADNGSTDGTREILDALGDDRVTVLDDPEPGYYQAAKMTALARQAADAGADWAVPFDADEFWLPAAGGTVKQALEALDPDVAFASASMLNHVSTDADPDELNPAARMGWRLREVGAMVKVACRPRLEVTIEQGNHDAHYPNRVAGGLCAIHHYPYRSVEQTIRKARNGAAAYAAAPDLPGWMGEHWRQHGQLTDEQLAGVFRDWWRFTDPAGDARLVHDPLPVSTAG